MDAEVVRQLGVERADEEPPLAQEHRLAVQCREDINAGTRILNPRRADEDPAQRLGVTGELDVGLKARDLFSVRIPPDGDVLLSEVVSVEEDHPGARAEHRPVEAP